MKPLSRRGIDLRPGAITSRLMCRLALFGRFSRFWFSEPRKENSLSGGVGGETAPLVDRGTALLERPEPRSHKESAHTVPDATLSKSAKGENDDVP